MDARQDQAEEDHPYGVSRHRKPKKLHLPALATVERSVRIGCHVIRAWAVCNSDRAPDTFTVTGALTELIDRWLT